MKDYVTIKFSSILVGYLICGFLHPFLWVTRSGQCSFHVASRLGLRLLVIVVIAVVVVDVRCIHQSLKLIMDILLLFIR